MNAFAVIISAIVAMGIGMLWYGPLFGKAWMASMGWDAKAFAKAKREAEKKGMGKTYAAALASNLVLVVALAYFIDVLVVTSVVRGAVLGALVSIGFVATSSLSAVLWEGKSVRTYLIYVSYSIVTLAVCGAILAAW